MRLTLHCVCACSREALLVVVLFGACAAGGCAGFKAGGQAGQLRSQSMRSDAAVLPGNYALAYFSHDNVAGTSIVLSDQPIDSILKGDVRDGQVLHMELLWRPKAGATPMDSDATNVSIRHIVISDGQVGIYAGAGFVYPSDNPEKHDQITFTLRDASMQLQECTAGFIDLLSPAQLTGTFTARHDDKLARQLYFGISQLVTNALGRTRYVFVPPSSVRIDPPPAIEVITRFGSG
jgi:hypothetical protein